MPGYAIFRLFAAFTDSNPQSCMYHFEKQLVSLSENVTSAFAILANKPKYNGIPMNNIDNIAYA